MENDKSGCIPYMYNRLNSETNCKNGIHTNNGTKIDSYLYTMRIEKTFQKAQNSAVVRDKGVHVMC